MPPVDPEIPGFNLVLVSIDTLRADHLSGYGYARPTSPRLDELAARGALFRDAVSTSSWTLPAHVSMLTGLDPPSHGLVDYPSFLELPEEQATLAEILAARGYDTAAFTGGGWISEKTGIDAGFRVFESKGRRFADTGEEMREWVEAQSSERPFFLFWHGFDVHKPYKPPAPYDRLFCGECASNYDTDELQPDRPRPSDADLDYVITQYDGEIVYADRQVGELLDLLEARGLLENTVFVVTSDHGDEFYEHGMVDHIHTLYDELIRVPWIVAGPGVPVTVIEEQVSTVDMTPTLLALLGIDVPNEFNGRARLGGESSEAEAGTRAAFSFTGFSEYPYRIASVRTDRWKLVVWSLAGMRDVTLEPGDAAASGSQGEKRKRYTYKFRTDRLEDFVELFDLSTDPGEQHDVSRAHPDVVESLSALLEERLRMAGASSMAPLEATDLDDEYIEQLKALGYLE